MKNSYYSKTSNKSNKELFFLYFVTFWVILFPKAGIRNGEIPIYISFLAILLLFFYIIHKTKRNSYELAIIPPAFFLSFWLIVCFLRNDTFLLSNSARISAISWFLLSPLLWIAVSRFKTHHGNLDPKIVIYCFGALSIFGLCQIFFGLEFFQISGLTIAKGDTYLTKNLSIFQGSNVIALKAPSTYQSGNLWGQIAALVFVWSVETEVIQKVKPILVQYILTCLMITAILISLSRTAWVAVVLGILFILFRKNGKFGLLFFTVAAMSIPILRFFPSIAGRFSFSSLTNSSGRGTMWINALNEYSISDWLFGRSSNANIDSGFFIEGLFGLFTQVGIIGFLLLIHSWKKANLHKWPALTVTILICVFIDTTYAFPPFLWIPAVLLLFSKESKEKLETKLGVSRKLAT